MAIAFNNLQSSVAITEAIVIDGDFPSASGGHQSSLAAIRHFAFAFTPDGTAHTHGAILPINMDTADLYSLVGTMYGGDGTSTFALPDLDMMLSVGSGTGIGLTNRQQGMFFGEAEGLLSRGNMMANLGGVSDPVDNTAPSLPVRYVINVYGTFNSGLLSDLGMVWEFAGENAPGGTLECIGQLLPISEYENLFNLIGTTYGGDGESTFALPDLRGRTIVGANSAMTDMGVTAGSETFTVNVNNLPGEMGRPNLPIDNRGPTVALQYMIAVQGIFPGQTGTSSPLDSQIPVLGEIIASAVGFTPKGFAACNGQLLPINQNQALFSLLGTRYGGNGTTTFALPDLRGRALVGAEDPTLVGTIYGDNDLILDLDNIPDLSVTGTNNIDILYGANEGDFVAALDGDDTLTGYAGNDWLDGGAGIDTMNGGFGDDTYVADVPEDIVNENADEGTDTIRTAIEVYSLGGTPNVENLTGTGTLAQELTGNTGHNRIDGGEGADMMIGDFGNDTFVVDNAGDVALELSGQGTDTVESAIAWSLGAHLENLTLTGTAAIDGWGNGLANILIGNSAANKLDGRAGADTMHGGLGDDIYYVDDLGDRAFEMGGAGDFDTVRSKVDFALSDNVEHLVLLGTAERGVGNASDNILYGNGLANRLDGGGGADSLRGGDGDDLYYVDHVGDVIREHAGQGIDIVRSAITFRLGAEVEKLVLTGSANLTGKGNALANTIHGNDGANSLVGYEADDILSGQLGNDKLYGGDGSDRLIGNAGADRYIFDSALNATSNVDWLSDYSVADDTILLDQTIFASLALGTLSASAFHTGSAASDAGDRIIYHAATGRIYYDSDGTGAAAQILFAQVPDATALSNADFQIVG